MQITVFGANGKVGKLVVLKALENDYSVNAFVHGSSSFKPSEKLNVIQGDIYSYSDVEKALSGSNAVISALGSWGTPKKDILTSGMTNIIPAMKKLGINRIITLTGAEARSKGDNIGIIHRLMHLFLSIFARKILLDGENHIKLLEQSNLEWTVLRSPVMNDRGSVEFKLSYNRILPWKNINREAVVNALINQITSNKNICKAPFIERA